MEGKEKLLLTLIFGMLLSDLVPTPADSLFFNREQRWKEELQLGKITPRQYWIYTTFGYYIYNPLWWVLVFLVTYYFGKDYKQKRNILIGILAAGAVIAVILKNIKKDEALYKSIQCYKKDTGEKIDFKTSND